MGPLAVGMIGSAVGAGLGMATGAAADKRQLVQQGKLNAQQFDYNKQMAYLNQYLAMDMWKKTNYSAQMKELEKAGLSVGMMYGGSGAGGATTHGGSGQGVSGGQAVNHASTVGMGMQIGLQNAMQAAQIENIKADTAKTEAEKRKLEGPDTDEVKAKIEALKQNVKNEEVRNYILNWENAMGEMNYMYTVENQEASLNQVKAATAKLIAETEGKQTENKITKETADDVINTARQLAVQKSLENTLLMEKGLTERLSRDEIRLKVDKISAEIVRMAEQTRQGDQTLIQDWQKILLDKIRTEFGSGDEARIIRWIESITGITGAVTKMKK